MILLFLPLLLFPATAQKLLYSWECGSDSSILTSWTRPSSKLVISLCGEAIADSTNLCCKEHDLCFEMHSERKFTQEYCDTRFCNCLQDVSDKTKNYECTGRLHAVCTAASKGGGGAFADSVPIDYTGQFDNFFDYRPLKLNMSSLVKACRHSAKVAIHCHNSVHNCLKKPHEIIKRDYDIVRHSHQDCRSTMHDCLQIIIDSEASEKCTAVAQSLSKQVNIYMTLDEKKYGKSIIETYPIIAARLLKQCNHSANALETCYLSYDFCAVDKRPARPKLYNVARRINIDCHVDLTKCVEAATKCNDNADCTQAKNLAISRIREKDVDLNHGKFSSWIPKWIAAIR